MHFVHLLLEVVVVEVALLCGVGAVVRIRQFGFRSLVLQGSEHSAAHDLIEPLRRWGQLAQVVVVQWAHWRIVEHFAIRVVQGQVDRVGFRAIRKFLAGKHDTVAGEAGL